MSARVGLFVLLVISVVACGTADAGGRSAAPRRSSAPFGPGPTATTTSAPSPTTIKATPPPPEHPRCPALDTFARMMGAMVPLSVPGPQNAASAEWRAARDAVRSLLPVNEAAVLTVWVDAAEADARDARVAAAANDPSQLVARARRLDTPEVRAAGERLEQALLARC